MGLAGNWEHDLWIRPVKPFHGNFVLAGRDISVMMVAVQAGGSYVWSCRTRASAMPVYPAASARNGLYCLFSSVGVLREPMAERSGLVSCCRRLLCLSEQFASGLACGSPALHSHTISAVSALLGAGVRFTSSNPAM